jgi:nickel-type superoxide dismutase maturation protease
MVELGYERDTIAVPRTRWSSPLRRVLVRGPSMAPALHDGDQLLVWLRPRRCPPVGTVVVVDLPGERGVGIKRLRSVAPDGSLWVQGDNPFGSTDSRQFGVIPAAALRGRVLLRLWPRPGVVSVRPAPDGPGDD